jgi:hypothetical protein
MPGLVGVSGTGAEVDTLFKSLRFSSRPIDYGALGHYRVSVRVISTTAQVANSRIFEVRNAGSNLMILTRLTMRALQVAAGTAQENSIDCFKCTSFSAVDTTNTVTPVWSKKLTTMGAATNLVVRALSGAAAGMTGGTMTKDSNSFATLPYSVAAAIATTYQWGPLDCVDDVNGTHPFVFANNEGFEIENRILNVTSYGIAWFIDCSLCEVTTY